MFGLSTGELLVVAALALLVIGPERLPRVMRTLGQYYGQLRRTADDLRRAFLMEADRQDAEERYRQLRERRERELAARKKVEDVASPAAAPDPATSEASGPVPNDLPPDAPHPSLSEPSAEMKKTGSDP